MFELIGAVTASVIAALLGNYLWEQRFRDRVRTRRVLHQDDRAVEGVLDLYGAQFSDGLNNYSPDVILSWLIDNRGQTRRKHTECQDIVLISEVRREVVAFLFCHYYPNATHAIVSYCARDQNSETARREDVMSGLFKRLLKILRAENPSCSAALFEVSEPRLRSVFRVRALRHGLEAKELLVAYRRPRYCLETEAEGDALHLMVVGLADSITGESLPKHIATTLLESLHLLGYGDYYAPTDPRHAKYQKYLRDRVATYTATMSEQVKLG